MTENLVQETLVSTCSAGLKLGEYVGRLADWCGKDGRILSQNMNHRAWNLKTYYPHVDAKAEVTLMEDNITLVDLMDTTHPKGGYHVDITPKEFKCKGYSSIIDSEIKKTCEGCPYERKIEAAELFNPDVIFG